MLPDFLGLGAMRSGTSWLDSRLRSHPDIYLPARRKEVHFFDWYYERGLGWYEGFFPSPAEVPRYRRVGEISPKYIFDPRVPARIRSHLPDCQFILSLRNPVDRAYSQYLMAVRDDNDTRSFREFVEQVDEVTARGRYAEQIQRYLDLFPRENLLVLIFERVMSDRRAALDEIAGFLGVDAARFPEHRPADKVNASSSVRLRRLYALAMWCGRRLRAGDMDWAVNLANRIGVTRMFERRGGLPPMDPEVAAHLYRLYEPEVSRLETLLDEDLSRWRA